MVSEIRKIWVLSSSWCSGVIRNLPKFSPLAAARGRLQSNFGSPKILAWQANAKAASEQTKGVSYAYKTRPKTYSLMSTVSNRALTKSGRPD
jgi:hypothetical protein